MVKHMPQWVNCGAAKTRYCIYTLYNTVHRNPKLGVLTYLCNLYKNLLHVGLKSLSHNYSHLSNAPNPRYIFPGGRSMEMETSHIPMFLHIAARSTLKYINMKTVKFYVQIAINLQKKCLRTTDCKNMENMLIDFIWVNVHAKYLIQTILYQIMATHHMGST